MAGTGRTKSRYSYRSASIGFRRDARTAGYNPATRPTNADIPVDKKIVTGTTRGANCALKPRKKRRPTRPTAASRARRLEMKKRRGAIKRERRGSDGID